MVDFYGKLVRIGKYIPVPWILWVLGCLVESAGKRLGSVGYHIPQYTPFISSRLQPIDPNH